MFKIIGTFSRFFKRQNKLDYEEDRIKVGA